MVTAEFAAVLPAVVLVLGMSLAGMGLVLDQIRCVDAARIGARAASRGEVPVQVRDAAARLAPEGARIEVEQVGDHTVRVTVSAPQDGTTAWLPQVVRPAAAVVAALEPRGPERAGPQGRPEP